MIYGAERFVCDWEVLACCVRGRTKNPPQSHEHWTIADFFLDSWSGFPRPGLVVRVSWSSSLGPGYLVQVCWSGFPGPGLLVQVSLYRFRGPGLLVQGSCSRLSGPDLLVRISWSRSLGPGSLVQAAWSRFPGLGFLVQVSWSMSPGTGCLVQVSWFGFPGSGTVHLVQVSWLAGLQMEPAGKQMQPENPDLARLQTEPARIWNWLATGIKPSVTRVLYFGSVLVLHEGLHAVVFETIA